MAWGKHAVESPASITEERHRLGQLIFLCEKSDEE